MGIRFSLTLTLALILIGAAFFFFSRPLTCEDPAGCVHLAPGEPLSIGIQVVSGGNGQAVSLELVNSASLAAQAIPPLQGHAIQVQPFYGNCQPNAVSSATVDLAGSRQLLAGLGPTCPQDAPELVQRLSDRWIGLVSPVPFLAAPQPGVLSFYPDSQSLADQAIDLLLQANLTRPGVLTGPDSASQQVAAQICNSSRLSARCMANLEDAAAVAGTFDAWLEVALDESDSNPHTWVPPDSSVTSVVLSFSRPQSQPGEVSPALWISPLQWSQATDFSAQYAAKYQAQPNYLSDWAVATQVSLISQAIQAVAVRGWDGSLLIPRQALYQKVTLAGEPAQPNRFSCLQPASPCQDLAFGLYSSSGNGYKIVDPLIQ